MSEFKLPLHRRLGFRMGLTAGLTVAILFAATGWVLLNHQRDVLTRALTDRVLATTRSLAVASAPLLLQRDPELQLNPMILKALNDNPDLVDITVLDSNGVIRGHHDLLMIGKTAELPSSEQSIGVDLEPGESAWRSGDQVFLVIPVVRHEQQSGMLVARATFDGIAAAVRALIQPLAVLGIAGMLILITMVLLLVTRSLRPLGDLRRGVAAIGSGDLSTRVTVQSSDELGMLGTLLNRMVEDLERAQSARDEKARRDHELEIARNLQNLLLPRTLERPRGYGVASHFAPALEVSGDYYDVIPRADGTIALVVADVSGKGVPGLVIMAMLRVVLRNLALPGVTPTEAMIGANEIMHGVVGRGMFITCVYGILDGENHRFTYCNAGHCPPILFGGRRGVRSLENGGFALGMFASAMFRNNVSERSLDLEPGEGLVLYTDGLVEAMNAKRDQLGLAPVLAGLKPVRSDAEAVQVLSRLVQRHQGDAPAADDLTLLAVKRETTLVGAPA